MIINRNHTSKNASAALVHGSTSDLGISVDELASLLAGVRCLLWHASVEERHGKLIWKTRIINSAAARNLIPIRTDEATSISDCWYECIVSIDAEDSRKTSTAALRNGLSGYSQEFRCVGSDGHIRWINDDVRIESIGACKWSLLGICTDITERKQRELQQALLLTKFRDLADRDPLTTLLNRRAILERMNIEWARWRRYRNLPFSIMMVDIDNFKLINDQFGHLAGDEVLRSIAERLHASVRFTDVVGRYGGEEFLLLLPETSLDGAQCVAQKLLRNICATRLDVDHHTISVTVSVGLTMVPPEEKNLACLIERADQALYKAKRNGKNQVVVG